MADDEKIDEKVAKMGSHAAVIYGQLAAIVKDEELSVIGAVLGALLAGFLSVHDFDEQMDVLQRVLTLVKGILRDMNTANGIQDAGDVQFQFVYEDGVREQIEKDPKMAEFVRDQTSRVRQALSDYQAGKYGSVDEAMRSAGLMGVDPDDLEDLKEHLRSGKKPS
jgi:hypothetical protein